MVRSVDLQRTYVKSLRSRVPLELTQSGGRPTDGDSMGGNLANVQSRSGRQMLLQVSIRSQNLVNCTHKLFIELRDALLDLRGVASTYNTRPRLDGRIRAFDTVSCLCGNESHAKGNPYCKYRHMKELGKATRAAHSGCSERTCT